MPRRKAEEAKPEAKEAKPATPVVTSITEEEFEKFEPVKVEKRSWVKEVIERAKQGPVKVEGLTKGQMIVLILNAYRNRLQIKYDMRRGVAVLAPPKQ